MEIAEQIGTLGKRGWLLFVLPLVVAGGVLAYELPKGGQFQGEAVILAPPSSTERSGAQYIQDFEAALKTGVVADAVADEVDLPAAAVARGLKSGTTASGSTLIRVTWVGTSESAAGQVPRLAAEEAFALLVAPRIATLTEEAKIAQLTYDEAEEERDAYTTKIGVALPPQAYQALSQETTQLKSSFQTARATGSDNAAALGALLKTRQDELKKLAPSVTQYNLLQSNVDRAYGELATARSELAQANAQLTAASGEGSIRAGSVRAISPVVPLIRDVVGAAIVGFGAALLLVIGLGRLSSPRPTRRPLAENVPAAQPQPQPWPEPRFAPPGRQNTDPDNRPGAQYAGGYRPEKGRP